MSSAAREGRRRRLAALAGSFTGALIMSSLALAGFSSGSSATDTVQTKRIFSGARTTGPRTISDNSSGSAVSQTDALSYADGTSKTTGSWASSISSTRYVQFNFNGPLPAGVAVSGATFDLRISAAGASDTACFYFEVHRQSDNSLLATHYSSGSSDCMTGTSFTTLSTSLPEITSSDIANDVYVKVFGRESAAKTWKIDSATLSLTEYSTSETLYQEAWTDASTGTGATTTWWTDAADSNTFSEGTAWPTTFSTTKYLQFTFPAYLPSGAVVTGATFTHSYKAATAGDNICHYFEVYSNTTLLATHGSSGSPYSCNSTTSFRTDSVSIPEVNTDTEGNTVVIKDYVKDATGSRKSIDDVDTLTLTYYLD
jgi:hypothetical protein